MMLEYMRRLLWAGAGISLAILCMPGGSSRAGDDVASSTLESILVYAKSIQGLNEKYADQLKRREALASEFNQIYAQFAEAGKEAQAINAQAQAEFQAWIQTYSQQRVMLQPELAESSRRERNFNRTARARAQDQISTNLMFDEYGQLLTVEQNLNERANQTQLAQTLNAQRQQQLQQELDQLGVKAQAWSIEDFH